MMMPAGKLLIIGGHENKGEALEKLVQLENSKPLEILKSFIDLIGKRDPVIEVITTASENGKDSFNDYKKAFELLRVLNVGYIHHTSREQVIRENLTERINKADAVFFTGGDQLKLTTIYGGTEFLCHLQKRYIDDSIVIAGTSAGATVLSTTMIYNGTKETQQLAGEVNIAVGFGFLKNACIDTHFIERGRFVRLAQVVALDRSSIGIGIEEDTALVVTEGIKLNVIGSGIVTIIDGLSIQQSNLNDIEFLKTISIRNLKLDLLSKGDNYEIMQPGLATK
jgi:cyanophycinase